MTRKAYLIILILLVCSSISIDERVEAAELLGGIQVLIGPDEVINEDVYVFAGRVLLEGTINGDLVAAGENIEINGAINGDLIVAGRSIAINSTVADDIRAAGADLQLSSGVGGDLIAAGNEIIIEAEAEIGEDFVAKANTVVARGVIEGNVDLSAVEANFAGTVRGNVDATVEDRLVLGPESTIGGALSFTSSNEVSREPGSTVIGEITQQMPAISIFGNEYQVSTFILLISTLIDQTKWFLSTLLVGLILISLFPETSKNVVATLRSSPWRSLGTGALVLALTPILLLLIMIALLSVLGFSAFPIVAVPGMMYTALLLLAKPLIAVSIGGYVNKLLTKREDYSPRSEIAIGAALLAVLGCIPFVDSIVAWLTLLLGFGVWLLYFHRQYREWRVAQRA